MQLYSCQMLLLRWAGSTRRLLSKSRMRSAIGRGASRTGREQLSSIGIWLLAFAALLVGRQVALGQRGQPGQIQIRVRGPQFNERTTLSGVYLPSDRSLSRAMSRARERLAAHEYHEALTFLQDILGREEDSFLERAGDDQQQRGLKATARQLIGELPAEGRDAYELLYGAAARRQLDAALRGGDHDGVAHVSRQFFHTSAGYEATFVLAQMESDRGHRIAAAQLYQELIDAPRAAAQFEPQLSVTAALNQVAAGRLENAAATIQSLVKRKSDADVVLAGRSVSLPAAGADPIAWLTGIVGKPAHIVTDRGDWLTLRGDPSRNSQTAGGPPHLRPRWEARVVNEPSRESYFASRSDDLRQRGVVAIPGAKPIVMGDVVVMRTPTNVVAIDWRTGKRIWETRDDEEFDDETLADVSPTFEREQWVAQGQPFDERMWKDALVTSVASDGQRVFVLRGISIARDEEPMGWAVAPGFGRVGVEPPAATNRLAAYDLATQGKLLWELDGGQSGGPLSGAFFLGAPLSIDNTLYAIAEMRMAIYLLALEPTTGKVRWQQQLLSLEQSISVDPLRRRVAATPSYSGGILVCPTAAGATIAVDVGKREFAWVYRYTREAMSAADARNTWGQGPQNQLPWVNDQWLDGSAVLAEGCAVLTPPESNEIHCLDARTGKLLWKRLRGDALFVGGVDRGRVLLVGSDSVQALQLSDGAPAWTPDLSSLPTGALPAGQGYMSEGSYFLPLTTGIVAQIDMPTGKTVSVKSAGPVTSLGNLICYRGSILSQSALVLDKFEQLAVLRQRTDAALARNAQDAEALRELAELKRADGNLGVAVTLLKRAFEQTPDDPVTRESLVEMLLDALASDYRTYHDDVSLLERLIRNRDQRIELMRINAAGLEETGERLAAVDAHLRLADFTAEEPSYLRIDSDYLVRSDRWISGRLAALWSDAATDERAAISAKVLARRPALDRPRTTAELRHYLAHLEQLPGAGEVQAALARLLIERGRTKEAELELLQMKAARERKTREAADSLWAQLSSQVDSTEDETKKPWPRGQVDVKLVAAPPQNKERAPRAPTERPTVYRPLRLEQDFSTESAKTQWLIAADCSELVGRNELGEDIYHVALEQKQLRESNLAHGARLGHLLFVALGGKIIAIDPRQERLGADGDLLWPAHSAERVSPEAAFGRRGMNNTAAKIVRRPVYNARSDRMRISGTPGNAFAALGPVTPRGVVFQEQNELKCVDPLSGETLWTRTDIPPGCELFGDSEFVIAADVSENVAHVIRVVDGRIVGKRELPKFEWLLTAGRNVAQFTSGMSHGNRVTLIQIIDVWSREKVFEAEYPAKSPIVVVEPNALAVYNPSGELQIIDVATAQIAINESLETVKDLQGIQTMQCGDDLFVCISGPVSQQFKSIGHPLDPPPVNGLVYVFDMKTKKPRWRAPVIVRNRGLVSSQPSDSPLLVFADRKSIRDAASGGGSQLRLLCLDKRTGESVYRKEDLPDTPPQRFRVRAERETAPVVALEISSGRIELTLTDRPRPPASPANDDSEAPAETVQHGLRGIGRQIKGALQGALDQAERPVSAPPQPSKEQDKSEKSQSPQGSAEKPDDD
jgi:outer membrane protein assembly factor BamB